MIKKLIVSAIFTTVATLGALSATYDGSMLYGYSTSPAGALQFTSTTEAGMAFQFTESDINYFRGCRITAIAVANGSPAAGSTATEQPITLFTASGFNSMGVAQTTMTFEGTMDLTKPGLYKEYLLPEPIEITEETEPVWFGLTAVCNPNEADVLMFDSWSHDLSIPGGMVGAANKDGEPVIWTNQTQQFGFGCVRVKIEGKNFPADEVSMLDCLIPDVVTTGTQEPIVFYTRNEAGNDINSLTVAYRVGNAEEQTRTFELANPLIYNDYVALQLNLEMPDEPANDLLLSLDIKEVNGVENSAKPADRSASAYCLAMNAGSGYPRNMVAEIATGTWCGYCPMGFVGVSKMMADHPDGTFIPIAVHVNDQMTTASYNLFQTNFTGSNAPVLVVNRNTARYGMRNPTYELMSQMYPTVRATPAMAQLSVDAIEIDAPGKKINVEASAEFAFDFADGNYALSFVLTEDNVGPYYQNNNYCQEGAPEMEEWNTLPQEANVMFNAVARQINLFNGINGTIPAEVKAGEIYRASASLRTNTVSNPQNCNIIVMLVNRTTGRIENAVTKSVAELPIHEVAAPATDAAIYDLQGRKILKPVAGRLYISDGKKFIAE